MGDFGNVGNLAIAVEHGEPGAAGARLCEYDDQGNPTRQYLLTCAHIVGFGAAAGTEVFRWQQNLADPTDQGKTTDKIGTVTFASDPSIDGIDVALIELEGDVTIAPSLGDAGIAAGFTSQADQGWQVVGRSWKSGQCAGLLLDTPAAPVGIEVRDGLSVKLSNVLLAKPIAGLDFGDSGTAMYNADRFGDAPMIVGLFEGKIQPGADLQAVITPFPAALQFAAARSGKPIQLICDRSRFHPPPPLPIAPELPASLPAGGEAGRGASTPPRGIRNCNPGNIRGNAKSGWEGLDPNRSDPSFCCFVDPAYGIRAMVYLIRKYQMSGYTPRCVSISDVVRRWAPPNENDVSAYLTDVAKSMNRPVDSLSQTETVGSDRDTLTALIEAIIHHENGEQPYGADVIDRGVQLGLEARVTLG